jgi:hypothetical protein
MKLPAKLSPFWYAPEFGNDEAHPVRFKLRPLTQEQIIEVEDMFTPSADGTGRASWNRRAQFRAAMISIAAVDGLEDANGEPLRWPFGIDVQGEVGQQLRDLICIAGMRIITEAQGNDWAALIAGINEKHEREQQTDLQPAEASAEKI